MNNNIFKKYGHAIKRCRQHINSHFFGIVIGIFISLPPLLWLYLHNVHEVRLKALIGPLINIILFNIICYFFLFLIFKQKLKSQISLFLCCFLFFSHHSVIDYFRPQSNKFLYSFDPLIFFILPVIIIFIYIKHFNNEILLKRIRIAIIIFAVYILFSPVLLLIRTEKNRVSISTPIVSKTNIKTSKKTTPDIYYFIIERYPSFETLEKRFNIKNNTLKKYLTDNNFYIASGAYPNYPHTSLSLASSLNMNYFTIDKLTAQQLKGDQTVLFENIHNNNLFTALKKNGYQIYNIGDCWQGTENNKSADINYNYYQPLSAFYRLSIELTPADTLFRTFYYLTHNRTYYKKIQKKESAWYKINRLPEIVKNPSKKIVFSHIFITHELYILDKNGSPLSNEAISSMSQEEKYKNHILYGNTIIQKLLKTIKKNKRPYIIILQADEGPYTNELRKKVDAGYFQWSMASKDAIKTHTSIINAYYFPDNNYSVIPPTITPVNTFRIILNNYFGTNLPILENKIYLNKSYDEFYIFKKIDPNRI